MCRFFLDTVTYISKLFIHYVSIAPAYDPWCASSESEFESGDTEAGSHSIPGNNGTLSASVLISIVLCQLPIVLMLFVGYPLATELFTGKFPVIRGVCCIAVFSLAYLWHVSPTSFQYRVSLCVRGICVTIMWVSEREGGRLANAIYYCVVY